MTYALDTNIIIHLLRNTPAVVSQYDEKLAQGIPIIIPPYVDFEIRRGLRYANATAKEQIYQRLCESCEAGEMRRETWVYAANLYSEMRHSKFTVGDADLLIAAFCLVDDYTLVTNNTKDFEKFQKLKLLDWMK
jgi:predicted nucleic acid-binding protein